MKKINLFILFIFLYIVGYTQHYSSSINNVARIWDIELDLSTLSTFPIDTFLYHKIDAGSTWGWDFDLIEVARECDSVSISTGISNYGNTYSEYEYTTIPYDLDPADSIEVNGTYHLPISPPWWAINIPFEWLVLKISVTGTDAAGILKARATQIK